MAEALAEDPDDALALLMQMRRATDAALRRRVSALVPRLILDRARVGTRSGSGAARLQVVRADLGGDIDLDASIEEITVALGQRRAPAVDELRSRHWRKPSSAVCLLLDRSGSMEGSRLVTAAMAAAACALRAEQTGTELAVIAFDRRCEVLLDIGAASTPAAVVDRVLGLRGHGVTSLDAACRAARSQLDRARAPRRIVVLLSDCRVTDDVDPLPAARAIDELRIIAPASDDAEARAFGARVGARVGALESIRDLPTVLEGLLGT